MKQKIRGNHPRRSSVWIIQSLFLIAGTAQAVPVAVIDSGLDTRHVEFKAKIWKNPKDIDDAVDNDDNGYIDDLNGWNFAENNNKLIDSKYATVFDSDIEKFFAVQLRSLRGEATSDDKEWLKSVRANPEFIKKLSIYGNYMHGTHVSGIAVKDNPGSRLIGIKLLPTEASVLGASLYSSLFLGGVGDFFARLAFNQLAKQQAKQMELVGKYVNSVGARVANCSFGTSLPAVQGLIENILKGLKMDATPQRIQKFSRMFIEAMVRENSVLMTSAPKTLFVVAAGNDGTNNDTSPVSPANAPVANRITVAATLQNLALASFSNYGEKQVDVAAPGVGILSAAPDGRYLHVSGTSQASPYVAQVASAVMDENPALTVAQTKEIILGTVDLKPFLKGKVKTGGVVNKERAIVAAKMSRGRPVSAAIRSAFGQIPEQSEGSNFVGEIEAQDQNVGYVMPLLSPI